MKAKPTTIWMTDEDRELANQRKLEYGIKTLTGLVRHWLSLPPRPPKKR